MFRRIAFIAVVLWIGVLANSARSENYFWLTNSDHFYLDGARARWFGNTGYDGKIRSNDTLFTYCPYGDRMITSATLTEPDTAHVYCPQFSVEVIEHADSFPWPDQAWRIREMALDQGNFFDVNNNVRARIRILDHELRISWGIIGTPIDTTQFEFYQLQDSSVLFFDCPIDISGIVSGVLIFGASGNIGLETDIRYACIDEDNDIGLPIPSDCPDKFALISEASIYVLNAVANGRDNSNGEGWQQQDPAYTDIVINGFVCALGIQFSFEEQNDEGDEYQGPFPDERGTIYLSGGLMQRHRGYVHRSNHGGTGYQRYLYSDERLRDWDFGVYNNYVSIVNPPQLSFGEVEVGDTAFMTVELSKLYWGVTIDSFDIAPPFYVSLIEDGAFSQIATVGFAPMIEGTVSDSVHFHLEYFTTSVPLSGIGSPDLSADEPTSIPTTLEISAYPNPFNSSATISYTIPTTGIVKISILDLGGRLIEPLSSAEQIAGSHTVNWNPTNLASGVYFCKVETANVSALQKLVLLK